MKNTHFVNGPSTPPGSSIDAAYCEPQCLGTDADAHAAEEFAKGFDSQEEPLAKAQARAIGEANTKAGNGNCSLD